MRFTVRRMMGVILLAALALVVGRFLSEFWAALNDTYYFASGEVERSWDVGPSPVIFADTFAGRICVVQSPDAKVTARVRPHVTTKESQATADRLLSTVPLSLSQEAGVVRITASTPPEFSQYFMLADVELLVPPDARLDVHTRQGEILVGQTYAGAFGVRSPTTLRSIKARADFDGRDWSYQGDILVELAGNAVDKTSPPPVLQLDGVRRVEIRSGKALVQARARGGSYLVGHETTTGTLQTRHEVEGKIRFIGSLGEGPNTFWAADHVRLQIPAGASFDLDAEATRGTVSCNLPMQAGGLVEPSRLRGVVGDAPKASVKARVEDGSMEIDGRPWVRIPIPSRPPSRPTDSREH